MDAEKKLFLKALKEKFEEDPKEKYTKFYIFGGWRQSARKREFVEAAQKLIEKRGGIPFYNPDIGVPLGQRKLMTYKISGTDAFVEGDDLHLGLGGQTNLEEYHLEYLQTSYKHQELVMTRPK